VELLLLLAVGVGLGVWLARRVEGDELRAGLHAVAVGTTSVVALPVLGASVSSGLDPAPLAMALVMVTTLVAAGPASITVVAAAGAIFETPGVFDERADRESEWVNHDAATAERKATS